MLSKLKPAVVSELVPKDIVRGRFDEVDGERHCLVGWLDEDFHGYPAARAEAVRAIYQELVELGLHDPNKSPQHNITSFNDNKKHSKKLLAGTYNRAMRSLGYTEDA